MHGPDSFHGQWSRRQVLALAGGAFVLALSPAALRRRRLLIRRTLPVMGTVAEVMVVHAEPGVAEAAIDLAFARLEWVDRTMSRFRADSDIGRVNGAARADAVAVDPLTADVVREALRWAELSGGRFDPALARLMEVWDVGRREVPPPRNAFARLAGRRLHRAVEVGRFRGAPAIRLHQPEAALDLGGIAKGFAVDHAIEALRAAGVRDAVVNAGGDLFAMGRSADGDRWRVGIRSARDPSRIDGELEVEDEAVATSGDYLQGFDYGPRRYHHLMDPGRGEPRLAAVHTMTVRAPSCLVADAAATTAFGLAPAEADRTVRRLDAGAVAVSGG